eukprot:1151534-Pelagomonas_calceolata.AAC.1
MPHGPLPQTPLSAWKLITHPLNWPTKKSAIHFGRFQKSSLDIRFVNVLKYRTGTALKLENVPSVFYSSSTPARCPLCSKMDSINHIALRCLHPTMNGMHTDRHHVRLSSCVKALSK